MITKTRGNSGYYIVAQRIGEKSLHYAYSTDASEVKTGQRVEIRVPLENEVDEWPGQWREGPALIHLPIGFGKFVIGTVMGIQDSCWERIGRGRNFHIAISGGSQWMIPESWIVRTEQSHRDFLYPTDYVI